jgi:hypothetical protein
MSTPDGSFEFQEVPSYLALHNLSLPEITSETNSELTSQSTSPTSASTQCLSPVSPITMAAPSTMLPRGHGSAPKFTPDVPRELQHYFKELELLFGPAQVVDNMEKKKHTCRYIDIDTMDLWKAIPEFDITRTFDEFKSAIFKLYPGSESERKWTIADMDKLVGEQLGMGILNVSDLGNHYRVFYTITQILLTKNRISKAEQS